MEDKDIVITLTETVERSKSNTHQIDEIKDEIKEIKKENKAIYELTSSVKLIVQDMSAIKDTVNEVKDGQKVLEVKMDEQISEVKQKIAKVDEKSKVDIMDFVKSKVVPALLSGGVIYGIIELVRQAVK